MARAAARRRRAVVGPLAQVRGFAATAARSPRSRGRCSVTAAMHRDALQASCARRSALCIAAVATVGVAGASPGARRAGGDLRHVALGRQAATDGSFRVGLYVWFVDPAGQFDIERDLAVDAAQRRHQLRSLYASRRRQGGTYTYARVDARGAAGVRLRRLPLRPPAAAAAARGGGQRRRAALRPRRRRHAASPRTCGCSAGPSTASSLADEPARYDSDFGYWTGRDGDFDRRSVLSIDVARSALAGADRRLPRLHLRLPRSPR